MKKIILSLAVIAVMGVVVVGVTRAWFSDTATSSGNTFTAGTLTLALSRDTISLAGDTNPISESGLYPGWTKSYVYTVQNTGSINGNLSLTGATVTNTPGSDATGNLGPNMNVYVTNATAGITDMLVGTLADLTTVPAGLTIPLAAGASENVTVRLEVPTTVGNEIQGDGVTGSFTLTLDQAH